MGGLLHRRGSPRLREGRGSLFSSLEVGMEDLLASGGGGIGVSLLQLVGEAWEGSLVGGMGGRSSPAGGGGIGEVITGLSRDKSSPAGGRYQGRSHRQSLPRRTLHPREAEASEEVITGDLSCDTRHRQVGGP